MQPEEYARYDALGLMDLLRQREISVLELHNAAQMAIEQLNPDLNFLVSQIPINETTVAAAAADIALPFGGLPFLIKEGHGLKGQPLEMGSRLGKGLLCEEDSELIQRLRKAGVIFLGSTNAPEFGNSPTTESILHGPVHNPWNLEHMCGGSSGGSSAAVAAGVVPVAQSSDGGGSIRTPAHCCGVFGLKPTRARTPVGPGFGGFFSLGIAHVATRSVRDSAAFLDVQQGPEIGALYRVAPPERPYIEEVGRDPGQLRVAFSSLSPSNQSSHPDCIGAVETAAKLCEELGHIVEEAAPVYEWDIFKKSFLDMWCLATPYHITMLEKATGKKASPDNLETCNIATWNHGKSLTAERIFESGMQLHNIVQKVEGFFKNWDVLITPVNLSPAPRIGEINANEPNQSAMDWFEQAIDRYAPFPPIFNATGQPAMSVPLCHSPQGLPIGVQCVARHGHEATLFRLAAQFEQAMPWRDRHPSHSLYS